MLQVLKELNRKYFRDIITEAAKDKDELIKAQLVLQSDLMDQVLQKHEKAKFQKFKIFSYL